MDVLSRLSLVLSIAPLLAAQTQFSTDLLALNPLGYWPLHGNANDASTRANHGNSMNGITFTGLVGPLGTTASPAAVFEKGRGQFVTVPAGNGQIFSFNASQPFTLMAWIKTVYQGRDSLVIVSKFQPSNNTGWALGIDNGELGAPLGGGRLILLAAASDTPVLLVESNQAVNDGGWHFVAATYDGTGTASGVRLYVDGVGVATSARADTFRGSSIANSAPLTIGGLTDQDSSFEGSVNEVAVFGVSLTPAQILQLAEDAPGFRRILGQFAFGGGWYSALYFNNAGINPVSFPVNFIGDNGSPLTVPSINGSSKTVTLAPGASTVIEASNNGPLVQGYASLVLPPGVNGYGVFRQSASGIADQEAVVPLTNANAQGAFLVYDETNFVTGVAIVNPSSVTATVTVAAFDINGNAIGTSTLQMPPLSKTTAALRSLPGMSGVVGKRGTVQFTVPIQTTAASTGNVAVLGLRFNGSAFTSIPSFGRAGN